MYTYSVCDIADEEIFSKQCIAIEKHLKPIEKEEMLEDVDGTKIQLYKFEKHIIKVVNSLYENEVYVESEIDISPYFS